MACIRGHPPAGLLEGVVVAGALREVEGFSGRGSSGGVDKSLMNLVLERENGGAIAYMKCVIKSR